MPAPAEKKDFLSMLSSKDGQTVAMYICFNITAVVGVVSVNKILYAPPNNFNFGTSLMCFHFMCTWAFVVLARKLGWFESKRIETSNYVKLGGAQTGSVGFVNLSLLYNTVSMYQLLKFSNILIMCVIEFVWKAKRYSNQVYLCLIALFVGVSMATVETIDIATAGLAWGFAGAFTTAGYQVLNKHVQSENDVKALQLLEFEQPWTAMWAAVLACFTDDVRSLAVYDYTTYRVFLLFLSGFFAFGVNVTTYLIIGKTSPVTFGVVGILKTLGIFLFGVYYMGDSPTPKAAFGILLAFASMIMYTYFMSTGQGAPPANPPAPLPPTPEEDKDTLVAVQDTDARDD